MGTTKNVDMSQTTAEVKIVKAAVTADAPEEKEDATQSKKKKTTTQKRTRSRKYQVARAQVDKTRAYDPFSAIELVKKLSYSKFAGTITAHLVLKPKEQNVQLTVAFPHSTGQTLRVAIADDALLEKIAANSIEFDVLLSTPQFMSKLAKLAAILGPRGLMPNPKNGTLTENPEKKQKELASGKITLKGERKAPLMHVAIGTTAMETKPLVENLQALLDALKNRLVKVTLAASMSPGVRVTLES